MSEKTVVITVEIDSEEKAMALAQFVKRAGFSTCRVNAVNDSEAYLMVEGLDAVREGLANSGFAPR